MTNDLQRIGRRAAARLSSPPVPLPASASRDRSWPLTFAAFGFALLIFAPSAVAFAARVTDIGALRVLRGEVPYRDFWTMYAPGSIYGTALAYRIFGEQMLVGNILGIVTSAGAVAAFHRLAVRLLSPAAALSAALLYAVAFFHAPYHGGFASYPPAILCIWLAAGRVAENARTESRGSLGAAGCLLGLGILFKHDLAGYASIACAAAVLLAPVGARLASLVVLAAPAAAVVLIALAPLIVAGAGADALRDLVIWPLTDFKHVRPEFFPVLPSLRADSLAQLIQRNTWWANITLPAVAAVSAVPALMRRWRAVAPEGRRVLLFALVFSPLVWTAAHVQVNTHRITLPGLGVLLGAAGLLGMRGAVPVGARVGRGLVVAAAAAWGFALLPEPLERHRFRWSGEAEPVGLPRLAGIVVPSGEAAWLRGLARAIGEAAPPESPILMVGRRNDVLIHANSAPYWLTERRIVTRHHELHPGITDTESVQREMLAAIRSGPPPVLVQEFRFGDPVLDRWKAEYQAHGVPVGATLLDEWVEREYRPGRRFDRYEVMVSARGVP